MEKKLQQIIKESKKKHLNSKECEQMDVFTTLCIFIPSDVAGNSFSLKFMCGAGNSETPEVEPIILHDESIPFTVDDFKKFMTNCSKKYDGQFEIIVPPLCQLFYGMSDEPTLEETISMIDNFVSDEDWSLCENLGLVFRIVDRTM